MKLEYIYNKLSPEIRYSIKGSLCSEHVRILIYDTKVAVEFELQHLDTELPSAEFKLSYLELKKSIMAYDEILSLINKLKLENANENI